MASLSKTDIKVSRMQETNTFPRKEFLRLASMLLYSDCSPKQVNNIAHMLKTTFLRGLSLITLALLTVVLHALFTCKNMESGGRRTQIEILFYLNLVEIKLVIN